MWIERIHAVHTNRPMDRRMTIIADSQLKSLRFSAEIRNYHQLLYFPGNTIRSVTAALKQQQQLQIQIDPNDPDSIIKHKSVALVLGINDGNDAEGDLFEVVQELLDFLYDWGMRTCFWMAIPMHHKPPKRALPPNVVRLSVPRTNQLLVHSLQLWISRQDHNQLEGRAYFWNGMEGRLWYQLFKSDGYHLLDQILWNFVNDCTHILQEF